MVIPGADFRSLVETPDFDTDKGKTASLLTYFDISSAEVRALCAFSHDKNMAELFDTGQDIYLHVCKKMLNASGEGRFEALSKADKKKWRKIFKRVVLASNYRQSAASLAKALNVSTEEAQSYLDALFNEFPQMAEFINKEASYPINHNGYVNTVFGDVLRSPDYRFLYEVDRFGRKRLNRRIVSKLDSCGINYKIQSSSALSLASSFDNMIKEANKRNLPIYSIGVIHDSNQSLISVDLLWDVVKFYKEAFYDFALEKYGLKFKYDLEIGVSYGEMMEVKLLENEDLQLTGTGSTLLKLLDKIKNGSNLRVELVSNNYEELIPKFNNSAMSRFIKKHQTCMILDESEYTIILRQI